MRDSFSSPLCRTGVILTRLWPGSWATRRQFDLPARGLESVDAVHTGRGLAREPAGLESVDHYRLSVAALSSDLSFLARGSKCELGAPRTRPRPSTRVLQRMAPAAAPAGLWHFHGSMIRLHDFGCGWHWYCAAPAASRGKSGGWMREEFHQSGPPLSRRSNAWYLVRCYSWCYYKAS